MFSSLIYQQRSLYLTWFILFVFGVGWTLTIPPETAIIYLNGYYDSSTVFVISWATRLGEWLGFVVVFLIIVLRWRYRELVALVASVLTMLLVVWFLKHMVYYDALRPSVYLEQLGLRLTNFSSYTLNRKFSFPSGHTAAGFTYFFFLGLCMTNNWVKVICLLLAASVAFSRVYLAQHFVADVTAGSLLGVLFATLGYYFLVYRMPWPESSINKKVISTTPDG